MKEPLFIAIWGSGKGPLRNLDPRTRLMVGFLVFAGCLISSPYEVMGLALLLGGLAIYILATGLPARICVRVLILCGMMLGPLFFLSPWIEANGGARASGEVLKGQLSIPWKIVARGTASVLVAAATASSLTLWELKRALARTPLPKGPVLVLFQILHQSHILLDESWRMARAAILRGATDGWKPRVLAIRSLPQSWLPRLLERAKRVAMAIELREYGEMSMEKEGHPLHAMDGLAILMATGFLLAQLIFSHLP